MSGECIIIIKLGGIKVDVSARLIGITVLKQTLDKLNVLIDAVGRRFDNIGDLDIELAAIVKESILIELCNLHDGLALALGACNHLVLSGIPIAGKVSDVCNIHNAQHIVSYIAQELFQHIFHDIGAQIADMRKMIDCRTTGIHFDLARLMCAEFIDCFC